MKKKTVMKQIERFVRKEMANKEFSRLEENAVRLDEYWHIGKIIAEARQTRDMASWSKLIEDVSQELIMNYGEFYTTKNILYFYDFYLQFANPHDICANFSWQHYKQFMQIQNDFERKFYMNLTLTCDLSIKTLKDRIKNKTYELTKMMLDKKTIYNDNFVSIMTFL